MVVLPIKLYKLYTELKTVLDLHYRYDPFYEDLLVKFPIRKEGSYRRGLIWDTKIRRLIFKYLYYWY